MMNINKLVVVGDGLSLTLTTITKKYRRDFFRKLET